MFGNKVIFGFAVFAAVVIGLSESYVYTTAISTNSKFPGRCYSEETKKAYDIGESFQRTSVCEQMTCGLDFRFEATGCGSSSQPNKKCRQITPDISTGYPNCCKKYECVDESGNKYRV